MNTNNIFDDCDETTTFEVQTFLVDPNSLIVNTVPPSSDDISGCGNIRYQMSSSLPTGFNYVGENFTMLESEADELCHRIGKARN